jgi:hypothetical protein
METEYELLARLRPFFTSKTPRPSIWKLCHFVAMPSVSVEIAESEIASAARDYGFSANLNTRTTLEQRDFYTQLLKKVEPLKVYQERMKGNLLQFATCNMDMITPRVKQLLQALGKVV